MEPIWWLVFLWIDGTAPGSIQTIHPGRHQLEQVNRRLHGQVLDFTHNHGADRRIWSPALRQRRDLYVYLPPGFDPCKRYPVAFFLHGAAKDEQFFLQSQAERFDQAIVRGVMPPVIVVAPDGSPHGRMTLIHPASFWANSKMGAFEEYLMTDVWDFAMATFPILPERDAHALVGSSMGGTAAVSLAIKHRDRVKVAIGFMPLLDLRYVDCHGKYRAPYDPECVGVRERFRGWEALGHRKLFVLRFNTLFGPLFGRGPEAVAGLSGLNPREMMERTDLRPGELDLYVAYGAKDEFNVAAQCESFLADARRRGLDVAVAVDPEGKHDLATGLRLLPGALAWVATRVPPPHQAADLAR
jgi:pimeloyl-ACP methyl ester carboxylesterase